MGGSRPGSAGARPAGGIAPDASGGNGGAGAPGGEGSGLTHAGMGGESGAGGAPAGGVNARGGGGGGVIDGGASAGSTGASAGRPGVAGRYDLLLSDAEPWMLHDQLCPDPWTGVPITLQVSESDGNLRGWVAPEWWPALDASLVELQDGVLHMELSVMRNKPAGSVDSESALCRLDFPVGGDGALQTGTATLTRSCAVTPLDSVYQTLTVQVPARVVPDRTPPRLRVFDERFVGITATLPIYPWTRLIPQTSEPVEGLVVPEQARLSAADAPQATTLVRWEPIDTSWSYTGHFADWTRVSGTRQTLEATTPLDDGAGNITPPGVLQTFDVVHVGPAHASVDFDTTPDIGVWGVARFAPPGDPLCEIGGCLVLGPVWANPCDMVRSPPTGFALRVLTSDPSEQYVKLRVRLEQSIPEKIVWYFVTVTGPSGGYSSSSFPDEIFMSAGFPLSSMSDPDGELRYTSGWGTIAVPPWGSDSAENSLDLSLPTSDCHPWVPSGWLRVIVDRVAVKTFGVAP